MTTPSLAVASSEASPGQVDLAQPTMSLRRASTVVFFANAVSQALGFAFPVVAARFLTKATFGFLYLHINGAFLAMSFATNGLPAAGVKFIASETAKRREWLATCWALAIPTVSVGLAASIALMLAAGGSVLIVSVVALGIAANQYYYSALQGRQRFGLMGVFRIVSNLVQLVVVVVLGLVAGHLGARTAAAAFGGSYLAAIAMIEVRARVFRDAAQGVSGVNPERLRQMARLAYPMLLSGIAFAFMFYEDTYAVRMIAPRDLATYSAAKTLCQPFLLLPVAIGLVLLAAVPSMRPAEQLRVLRKAGAAALLSGGLFVTVGIGLAGPIVAAVYPVRYAAASGIFQLLVPAVTMLGAFSVLSQWLVAVGRPWLATQSLVLGTAVVLLTQVPLGQALGGQGVAIALSLGMLGALTMLGARTLKVARGLGTAVDAHA